MAHSLLAQLATALACDQSVLTELGCDGDDVGYFLLRYRGVELMLACPDDSSVAVVWWDTSSDRLDVELAGPLNQLTRAGLDATLRRLPGNFSRTDPDFILGKLGL